MGWQSNAFQPMPSSILAPAPQAGPPVNHLGVNSHHGSQFGSISVQAAKDSIDEESSVEAASMSMMSQKDAQGPPPLVNLEGSSASDMALRKSKSMHALGNNNVIVSAGPGVKVNGPQATPMRSSASVASIPSPAPPGFGHFSPLMGHRNTMSSASPLRGSAAAPPAANPVAALNAGISSPLLMPKRGVLQQGRGPQRSTSSSFTAPSQQQHTSPGESSLLRQPTPVPAPGKNPEARPGLPERRSTGAQANGHNPSPNMMQRSVSSQALRMDRAGGKPADKAVVRTTGQFAVSPERQRPAGPAPGINPARGMSPQQRPQR